MTSKRFGLAPELSARLRSLSILYDRDEQGEYSALQPDLRRRVLLRDRRAAKRIPRIRGAECAIPYCRPAARNAAGSWSVLSGRVRAGATDTECSEKASQPPKYLHPQARQGQCGATLIPSAVGWVDRKLHSKGKEIEAVKEVRHKAILGTFFHAPAIGSIEILEDALVGIDAAGRIASVVRAEIQAAPFLSTRLMPRGV